MPTNLLPFPTHSSAKEWNWREILLPCFQHTGSLANKYNMRLSFHADEYTVINSNNDSVFNNSYQTLIYLSDVLDLMGIIGHIVIHIGGVYGDKAGSKKRFISNFYKLPQQVRSKLVIENDDKQYDWKDALEICREIGNPMVLDIHHHRINNSYRPLTSEDIKEIFSTWNGYKPKIHVSSPQHIKNLKPHADYINIEDFLWFHDLSKSYDYDIMLEAKAKELAVIKFRDDLKLLYMK